MSSTILVTRGIGLLGSQVVPLLRHAGHKVRVLSRHDREPGDGVEYVAVDLMTGDGLDEALEQVRTVLHLAGGPKSDDVATRNLVQAAQRAGTVEHLVLISVTARTPCRSATSPARRRGSRSWPPPVSRTRFCAPPSSTTWR